MLTNNVVHFGNFDHPESSLNTYEGVDPSLLNSTIDYTHVSQTESRKFRCFETTLVICSACDLPPDQTIQESKEAYGQNPPPIYFEWWRSHRDEFKVASERVTVWVTAANQMGLVAGGAR